MIRFVDLDTGNTFDGHSPYVFWFDGEQSTGIIYTKKICFISHDKIANCQLVNNSIFSLINVENIENSSKSTLCNVSYCDLNELKTTSITSYGYPHHNYWVHMIYIVASTEHAGEYLEDLNIDGDVYTIGADFYDAEESLYINLANNGVEIPNSIQKAIYDMDIREDRRDNILLNRKWKELLSNLWDIICNRGSYKSLINSLKWFEYGDILRMCEMWKRDDGRYFVRDIQAVLEDKYFETLVNTSKTTYTSLYLSLEKIVKGQYDEDKNPLLEKISSKWSTEELSLKLSLLGNFFKTYFMPIHLDLIHSTIEDVVYTNTFKMFNAPILNRMDFLYDVKPMKCNIDQNKCFKLGVVKSFVGPKTMFGSQYGKDFDSYENLKIVGVQKYPYLGEMNDDEKKTYTSQLFNSIGVVVDVELELEDFGNDFVKKETLILKTPKYTISRTSHNLLTDKNVNFSILCQDEGEYTMVIQLDTANGFIYIKKVSFVVLDAKEIPLKIYKIHNELSNIRGEKANDFINRIQSGTTEFQIQYIPANLHYVDQKIKSQGIRLNHMMILNDISSDPNEADILYHLSNNYDLILNRGGKTVYISKYFDEYPELHHPGIYKMLLPYIYKEKQIYIPEKHVMTELGKERGSRPESMDYYTITDDDALCVVPELSYGLQISEPEWIFRNASTGKNIVLDGSIREPFIANTDKSFLEPGYYDIIFRYRLGEEINEVTLESAFVKR